MKRLMLCLMLWMCIGVGISQAQNHPYVPLIRTIDQAEAALNDNNITTAQSLLATANALITTSLIRECPALESAKPILTQASNASNANTVRILIDSVRDVIEECMTLPLGDTLFPYHNRGVIYLEWGEYERAIADFTVEIDNADGGSVISLVARGSAYRALGQYDLSLADYDQAIRINPDMGIAYRSYIGRGITYYSMGDYASAVADFTQALTLNPDATDVYFNRGMAYTEAGDYAPAIADFTELLSAFPNDFAGFNARGNAYRLSGDYARALADYERAIRVRPDSPIAYYHRGITYEALEEYALAIESHTEALRLAPDFALAYNARGNAHAALDNLQDAITDYTQAIQFDPDYDLPYLNRAIAYAEQGNTALAEADLGRYLALGGELSADNSAFFDGLGIEPSDLEGEMSEADFRRLFHEGVALADANNFVDAIDRYTQIIDAGWEDAAVYNNRGTAYFQLQDDISAIADFTEAIRINPRHVNAYVNRALSYGFIGDIASAEADLVEFKALGGTLRQSQQDVFQQLGVSLP